MSIELKREVMIHFKNVDLYVFTMLSIAIWFLHVNTFLLVFYGGLEQMNSILRGKDVLTLKIESERPQKVGRK